jgi:hypothetical protein
MGPKGVRDRVGRLRSQFNGLKDRRGGSKLLSRVRYWLRREGERRRRARAPAHMTLTRLEGVAA